MTWLPWIDLETTGLIAQDDLIVEIALVLTSEDLTHIKLGPSLVIFQKNADIMWRMADYVRQMHAKSGLLFLIEHGVRQIDAETKCLEFLEENGCLGQPLCGSNVSFDRAFIDEHMPTLGGMFHYRNIDVSSFKEACTRWAPNVAEKRKSGAPAHRAQADILESIGEMRYYKQNFLQT